MSATSDLSVSLRDFSASVRAEGRSLVVCLSGNADMAAKDSLDSLLPRVHAEALRMSATEVQVDFRQLEFMNSSCFKSFVSWISELGELERSQEYKIRLLSNPEMHWQRRSLHALRCFAVDLITVES
ncbi:hypothetical protein [Polyangium jinanense]|uniref:STAS domain-containing protein n=1 Tax=Polyangium jinanense TaxID=2829994 RepID=A0A9X3X2Y8_9BACT|nr:hypothetical protein [Polyangium jinanense]MDC3955903.1 hypothetical protein [Polyangium jinanense]MDC3983262.1 hypothetical protein [Polyangium jinanense]MDC3985158.1 hypothetical protein [Polyangium jinanense]